MKVGSARSTHCAFEARNATYGMIRFDLNEKKLIGAIKKFCLLETTTRRARSLELL